MAPVRRVEPVAVAKLRGRKRRRVVQTHRGNVTPPHGDRLYVQHVIPATEKQEQPW